MDAKVLGHDLAYPAMLTFPPHGLLGLVLASLVSAYMSTVSTQLNWGASYVVNDFYRRFIAPDADERTLVLAGRMTTVVLMFLAGWLALYLESALQGFNVLLTIGAGTGLLFLLRWFWWRISAFSEIAAKTVVFRGGAVLPVRRFAGLDFLPEADRRYRRHHAGLGACHLPVPGHGSRRAGPLLLQRSAKRSGMEARACTRGRGSVDHFGRSHPEVSVERAARLHLHLLPTVRDRQRDLR